MTAGSMAKNVMPKAFFASLYSETVPSARTPLRWLCLQACWGCAPSSVSEPQVLHAIVPLSQQTHLSRAHSTKGRLTYQVYKARLDEVKDVAVKFLLPCDLHLIQQFAAEVDLCRACRDENLVTFTGAWFQQVGCTGLGNLLHELLIVCL